MALVGRGEDPNSARKERICSAITRTLRTQLEGDRALAPASIDDMDETRFGGVVLKEYPVDAMNNAIERRIVSMILPSDGRLACHELTAAVQVVDECIRVRFSELSFYVVGDLVRFVQETGGVNGAAHGARLRAAPDRGATFQFGGQRILAADGATLSDIG